MQDMTFSFASTQSRSDFFAAALLGFVSPAYGNRITLRPTTNSLRAVSQQVMHAIHQPPAADWGGCCLSSMMTTRPTPHSLLDHLEYFNAYFTLAIARRLLTLVRIQDGQGRLVGYQTIYRDTSRQCLYWGGYNPLPMHAAHTTVTRAALRRWLHVAEPGMTLASESTAVPVHVLVAEADADAIMDKTMSEARRWWINALTIQ